MVTKLELGKLALYILFPLVVLYGVNKLVNIEQILPQKVEEIIMKEEREADMFKDSLNVLSQKHNDKAENLKKLR